MHTTILCLSGVLGLLLSFQPGRAAEGTTAAEAVDAYLQQLGASNYHIIPVHGPYIPNTFPEYKFFGVYFDQWPVQVSRPPELAASNVFYVDRATQQVSYLTSPDELQEFFVEYFSQIVNGTGGSHVVAEITKTWLSLSEQFSQDGYFQFSKPVVQVDGRTAFGTVVVTGGGQGYISVVITFTPTGGISIEEDRHVITGPRPI